MCLSIVFPYDCHDDPTWKSALNGLAGGYRRLGHEVAMALDPDAEAVDSIVARSKLVHLHLTGLRSAVASEVARCCRQRGVTLGTTVHDYHNVNVVRAGRIVLRQPTRAERRWLGQVFDESRWVTALSPFVAAELGRWLPAAAKRLRTIPDGVEPAAAGGPVAGGGAPFALCVARGLPYKGLDVLLMAWAAVRARLPGIELAVCGLDAGSQHYRRLAAMLGLGERVRFLGYVPRPRLLALLRSCLFYVQPSRRESFGLAVLEAMAHGKAVLATRCGIPEDLVIDGKTGLMVAPGDVAALARGLAALAEQPALRRALGREALARSRDYHWKRVAAAYLRLNRESSSARPRRSSAGR